MEPISAGQALTPEQQRAVLAALALRGLDLKSFAMAKGTSYSRLQRVCRGQEAPSPSYAALLNTLVRNDLIRPVRSRAFTLAA